jgi:hypothetical protein
LALEAAKREIPREMPSKAMIFRYRIFDPIDSPCIRETRGVGESCDGACKELMGKKLEGLWAR